MELLNPHITVQNLKGENWLVSMEHAVGEMQYINTSLLLPRGRVSVQRLQVQLMRRAAELLNDMANEMDNRMQGDTP